jgi:ribonuclease P protein component
MSETPSGFSLAKSQRLAKPTEYQQVYSSKFWGGTPLFSFNALPTQTVPRLGVTVSKKVSKSAVIRNRIRRQIKEFYRLHQQEFLLSDVVITAKPASRIASDLERIENLEELLIKIKKWRRWYDRSQACKPALEQDGPT